MGKKYEMLAETGNLSGDEILQMQIMRPQPEQPYDVASAQFMEPMRASVDKSFAEIRKDMQDKALQAWVEAAAKAEKDIHEKSYPEEIQPRKDAAHAPPSEGE